VAAPQAGRDAKTGLNVRARHGDGTCRLGQNGAMRRTSFHSGSPALAGLLLAAACAATAATAAEPAHFTGKLVLELIDEIGFNHKFRLLDDLAFVDDQGNAWIAPRGSITDDESLPRELHPLHGLPYIAEYRKAAVVHRYFSRAGTESWKQVHRVLYQASIAEGVSAAQARSLYAAVYAAAWRWEPRTSSCFRSCHAASSSLSWKPAVSVAQIQPVLDWIARELPELDAIDERVDAVVRKPGPHLFAQGKE
jgi:hypothetical protein